MPTTQQEIDLVRHNFSGGQLTVSIDPEYTERVNTYRQERLNEELQRVRDLYANGIDPREPQRENITGSTYSVQDLQRAADALSEMRNPNDTVFVDPEHLTYTEDNSPYGVSCGDTLGRSSISYGYEPIPEIEKEKLFPKNYNKMKNWSISARALKNVIQANIDGRNRYDYKFQSYYDSRYNISRVWNCVTNNVVCSIKRVNNKVIIRYREKSFYSPIMSDFNGSKIGRNKIIAIPSENLGLHRNSSRANQACSTKEAEIGFRTSMYRKAISDKKGR